MVKNEVDRVNLHVDHVKPTERIEIPLPHGQQDHGMPKPDVAGLSRTPDRTGAKRRRFPPGPWNRDGPTRRIAPTSRRRPRTAPDRHPDRPD